MTVGELTDFLTECNAESEVFFSDKPGQMHEINNTALDSWPEKTRPVVILSSWVNDPTPKPLGTNA